MSQNSSHSIGLSKFPSTRTSRSRDLPQAFARFMGRFLLSHPFVGSDFLRLRVANQFVPPPHGLTVVRTVLGCHIEVDPVEDGTVELGLYRYGVYEAGTIRVLRGCIGPADVFVDAGASVGLMSLIASRLVGPQGRVFAFEPQESSFTLLERNVARNLASNVSAFQMGLGSAKGSAPFYLRTGERGGATLVRGPEERDASANVQLIALDDFARESGVDRFRMLKIDVEGWELEVLRGGLGVLGWRNAPIVCIEFSHAHPIAGGDPFDIYQTLTTVNEYRVFRLARGKDYGSRLVEVLAPEQLPRHDNLFCFLPSHLPTVRKSLFARTP